MTSAATARKKAYGVYYTPGYVVDYIVRTTIGRLLERQDLPDVQKLRILDPACGRGAFLLGAYHKLLLWHQQKYLESPAANRTRLVKLGPGQWRLTTNERLRILSRNIFGVDQDRKAVHRARLALWLTALEGESPASALADETNLDLRQNIQSADALLGDAFTVDQLPVFQRALPPANLSGSCRQREADPQHATSAGSQPALDWGQAFPKIQREGGFDVVIGNPPYHRERDHKLLMQRIRNAPLGSHFHVPRMDLWYYFVHRGLELLKQDGQLSFITSSYWMSAAAAHKLIATLRDHAHVDELFVLGDLKIFKNVSGQHMILSISKRPSHKPTTIKIVAAACVASAADVLGGKEQLIEYQKYPRQLFRGGHVDPYPVSDELLVKIEQATALGQLGKIRQGIAENPAAINRRTNLRYGRSWKVGQGVFVLGNDDVQQLNLLENEYALLRPYHKLTDLGRYFINPNPSHCLIYSTRRTCPNIDEFPTIREHLGRFRVIMDQRRETRSGSNRWWHLHWPRDEAIWQSPKIVSLQMGPRPSFVPAVDPCYVPFSTNVFLPADTSLEHLYFLTGILNSRLVWKWLRHHAKSRGTGLEINGHVLSRIPVPQLDSGNNQKRKRASEIINLVEQTLSLPNSLVGSQSVVVAAECIDKRIDRLVYELYDLDAQQMRTIDWDCPMH